MPTIPLLYEDEHLIVVDKPAGILTLPDRFDPAQANLRHYFEMRYGRIFVVHRLDRDTSGALVLARTEAAHSHLNQQFEARTVQKIYHAMVDGAPPAEGRIEQPIAGSREHPGRMVVTSRGKEARTDYRVLESFGPFSWVEILLHTGRTHQIRVHFQHIGHPLAVDPLYGRRQAFYLSEVKGKQYRLSKDAVERPLVDRLTLHASQLAFDHPDTGERLSFPAPLPKDLRAMLNQLRKLKKM